MDCFICNILVANDLGFVFGYDINNCNKRLQSFDLLIFSTFNNQEMNRSSLCISFIFNGKCCGTPFLQFLFPFIVKISCNDNFFRPKDSKLIQYFFKAYLISVTLFSPVDKSVVSKTEVLICKMSNRGNVVIFFFAKSLYLPFSFLV